MVETIIFKEKEYPLFQTNGPASKYCIPYALNVCKGTGLDIGCNKKEWAFPGSLAIDETFNDGFNALNLPEGEYDYIFSSHCLEHIYDWVKAMDLWYKKLKKNGVLFLYLPHYNQEYWRPWNDKKHIHCFTNKMIYDYMKDKGYIKIFYSERDLYDSFMIFGEKQ